jgi:hypothetical protein
VPLGYDADIGLSWAGELWALLGWVNPGGDVWIERDWGGDGFEFYLGCLAFAWGYPHGGFDINNPEGIGLGFDEAATDGCSGLEDKLRGSDAALDVGGVGDDGGSAADAHGVDLAGDADVAGTDDEVCVDLGVFFDDDIAGGLDGGAPVALFDVDITDL